MNDPHEEYVRAYERLWRYVETTRAAHDDAQRREELLAFAYGEFLLAQRVADPEARARRIKKAHAYLRRAWCDADDLLGSDSDPYDVAAPPLEFDAALEALRRVPPRRLFEVSARLRERFSSSGIIFDLLKAWRIEQTAEALACTSGQADP